MVTSEGKNPRYWELTDLGRFILSMYGEHPIPIRHDLGQVD